MESDEPPQSNKTLRLTPAYSGNYKLSNTHPAVLILLHQSELPSIFELYEGDYKIGRNSDNKITLQEHGVSRTHSRLIVEDNKVFLIDLESTNGTFINNDKIDKAELKNNDIVRIGEATLKFISEGELELSYLSDLYRAVKTDNLTSSLRREAIIALVRNEFNFFKSYEKPLSILFLDIDHFKRFNDTYGHQAGDYVLSEIVFLLSEKALRDSDSIGRYGGEEFLIHLPETQLKDAINIAERARNLIENHEFKYHEKVISVTISIGVANAKCEDDTIDDLINRADQYLYNAKNNGRNQVFHN